MKTKFTFLFAVAILVAASSRSFADEKSHRKAAEDLLKTMSVEKQLQSSIDQSLDLQIKANAQLGPFREVLKAFFNKHMSWSSLKDEFMSIDLDAFTEEELIQIRAFYQTPVGKKMVEKTPELMSKGMQLGAKRVADNQAELRQMIQEEASKKSQ